jgi:hypothetical protein
MGEIKKNTPQIELPIIRVMRKVRKTQHQNPEFQKKTCKKVH